MEIAQYSTAKVCSLQLPSACILPPVCSLRFTLTGYLSMYLSNELSKRSFMLMTLGIGLNSAKAPATDGNVPIFY